MSHRLFRRCLAVLLFGILASVVTPLGAVFLWSAKASVHTDSHDTCISFAQTAMLELHFKNVTKSADEVAGFTGTAYAAITCVGLKPSAVAIVMVASDDQPETTRVANLLADKISHITIID
jgi:hypothetical protein